MQWVRRSVYRVWIVGRAISAVDPITWQGFVLLWVLVLSIFRVNTVLHHFQTIESAFIMVRIWKKPFFRATYLSGFIQKRAKNWKNPENESTLRTKTCIIKKIKKKGKCTYECIRMHKTWIFAKMMSFAIRLHSEAHFSVFLKNCKHEWK